MSVRVLVPKDDRTICVLPFMVTFNGDLGQVVNSTLERFKREFPSATEPVLSVRMGWDMWEGEWSGYLKEKS